MSAQRSLGFAGGAAAHELVVTLEHDDWGHIGVFIDRAAHAVHVMAVDPKGKPTGSGLRLRGSKAIALAAAIGMAVERLKKGST